ncbi:CoA-binding protein [Planctomycetota bacterium]
MADTISEILKSYRTIAIVGLSNKPERDSYLVGVYLKDQGYKIIPVNPNIGEILGETSYADLLDIPCDVDIVVIFRKPEFVPDVVESAIKKNIRVVWMQEGIVHNASADRARQKGMKVVMDRCIMKEHVKILGENK